jgi:hypothetical protein
VTIEQLAHQVEYSIQTISMGEKKKCSEFDIVFNGYNDQILDYFAKDVFSISRPVVWS